MALNKSVATASGVPVEYWKIASVNEDFIAQSMTVILAGYVTAALRQSGASPLVAQTLNITGDAYSAERDRAGVYTTIKAMEAWAGAEDC